MVGVGGTRPGYARHRFLPDDRFRALRWHDGAVKFRVLLAAATLSFGVAGFGVAGCGGMATPHPATVNTSAAADGGGVADNPFIPADQNLSTCVSSLPRPNCGSELQGGWRQGLLFGLLMLGMAFIGWRIFHSVRRRDQNQNQDRGSSPAN